MKGRGKRGKKERRIELRGEKLKSKGEGRERGKQVTKERKGEKGEGNEMDRR